MTDSSPGPIAASPETTADDDDDDAVRLQAAARLRRQHTRWVVIWVADKEHYGAWPLFRAPRGTALTAETPEQMEAQINQVEQAARLPRARTRRTDS